MKKLLLFVAILSAIVACSTKENEAAQSAVELTSYGPVKVDTTGALTVDQFFADFEEQDSVGVYTVRGKIVEKCTNAGCWVGIDKGNGDYFMVSFKDHFTIPLDTKIGTEAYFHGVARWEETSVEDLRAAAKEEGKSQSEIDAITEPEYSYGFEADGISLIKK